MNPYSMFGRGGEHQVIQDLLKGITQQQLARMKAGYNPGGFGGDFSGMSAERLQQIAKMMQAGQQSHVMTQGGGQPPLQFFLQHHLGDGLFAGLKGQNLQGDPFRRGGQQEFPGGGGPGPGPIGTPEGPPLGGPTIVSGQLPGQGIIPGRGGVGRPPFAGGIGRLPGRGLIPGRPPFRGGIGRFPMQPLNGGMHQMMLMRALGR